MGLPGPELGHSFWAVVTAVQDRGQQRMACKGVRVLMVSPELNVCVPPDVYVEVLIPTVMVFKDLFISLRVRVRACARRGTERGDRISS